MEKAELLYQPNALKIVGPSRLLALMTTIEQMGLGYEEKLRQLHDLYSNWYVNCAITGEKIPITQLLYWSVEKQEAYVPPQNMPKDILRDTIWGKRSPENLDSFGG